MNNCHDTSGFIVQQAERLRNFLTEEIFQTQANTANTGGAVVVINDDADALDENEVGLSDEDEEEMQPMIQQQQPQQLRMTPSNEEIAAMQASILNNLKNWLPFFLLLLIQSLLDQSMKILYIVISFVIVGDINKTFTEAISGATVVAGSFTSAKFTKLILMTTSSLAFSYLAFGWIMRGNEDHYLISKHLILFPQNAASATFMESIWLAASLDLFVQQISFLVKILFWFICSSNTICIRGCGPNICPKSRILLNKSSHSVSRFRGADIESGEDIKSNVDLASATSSGFASHQRILGRRSRQNSGSSLHENTCSDTHSVSTFEDTVSNQQNQSQYSFPRVRRFSGFLVTLFYFYRCILPTSVWFRYFSAGPLPETCIILYLFFKATKLSILAKAVVEICQCFFRGQQEFGQRATQEETSRHNSECFICFDDVKRPIILPCSHIFCEHCIYEWLDSKQTCPVCRATVSSSMTNYSIVKSEVHSLLPVII